MKSMQEIQFEMLSRCYKKDGWPKPFMHIGGVMQLARDQKHLDELRRKELWVLPIALTIAGSICLLVYVFVNH